MPPHRRGPVPPHLGEGAARGGRPSVAARRASSGPPQLTISVDISARQLERGDLVDDVANALRESGLPPRCLVLEMIESVLVEHTETNLEQVRTLERMSIRLVIDDFGTGYSSLAYLHRFRTSAASPYPNTDANCEPVPAPLNKLSPSR
jgi:EAL domain